MTTQLDYTTKFEPPTVSPMWQKVTIKSDRLKTPQQLHALAINIIPLLGSIAAIAIASHVGIGFVEVGLLVSMYVLTFVGITVGFHRHFAHCAFHTNTAVRVILAILGSMACQGPLIYWVSNHRRHHQYSDQPGDPHSPYCNQNQRLGQIRGLWHAQIGWTFTHEITNTFLFSKDLLREPALSKVNQLYYVWILLGLTIPSILGGMLTGTSMGVLSGFLWGGCVRLFLSYHFTNSINSITHLYGSRPFNTREQSTNNIWLAIPTHGESWHNNHHAFPNSAKFGLKWWQIDLGYWVIRTLELTGLVWNVKAPTTDAIEAKKVV
ncbi:MAG: acyl-CoA desaturase [Nostoc sp. DedSLP03]|uniref:acyl-CoA desaturase n=1 Tax=Nostoc sp. DedSLP03 TaxID=3075400 RepID=UPI002AD1DC18|nr:acyl-CoA desaturase [Nostoc sp. DedSLP03]MDZ7963741.1 acyl-CoA desaturase [Nostoc sp. DedSLP03]